MNRFSDYAAVAGFGSRVYVERGIFEYCAATHQDVARYCKSIEPALPDNVTLRVYDPNNPEHVDDIVNNGSILVAGASLRELVPAVTKEAKHWHTISEEKYDHGNNSQFIDPKSAFPDLAKQQTLNILKSQGIGYSDSPLGDDDTPEWGQTNFAMPRKGQPQKVKQAFNIVIDALNK